MWRRSLAPPPSGGTLVSTETVSNGVAPPSAAHTFGAVGTFYWAAFYTGGPNNLPAASICATEPLVVKPAVAQLTTVLSPAGGEIDVGGSASDAATLAGVTGTAGGTVAYRFYGSLVGVRYRCGGVPRHPASGRHAGVDGDGDRTAGAAVGRGRVRCRGHLLLGRVLLRRPQATSRPRATAPPSR